MSNKTQSKNQKDSPKKRISYIRSALGLSRQYIFEKYRLSVSTLRNWETDGTTELSPQAIKKLIDIYTREGLIISKEWILTGKGLHPQGVFEIGNLFGNSPDKKPDFVHEEKYLIMQEANFFKDTNTNAIVLMVSNEEMLPIYSPGDYVGGRYHDKEMAKEFAGNDCIVLTHTGKVYFRRLVKSLSEDSYNLVSLNPTLSSTVEPVIYNVDINCIAPVIWHRREKLAHSNCE